MDDCNFIVNVDRALLSLIWKSVKEDPKTQVLISNKEQISYASPKTCERGSEKLSVFLYNIIEEAATRNQAPLVDSSGKRTAQTSFALRYLVTPCTGSEESDHLLLGKIIQIFANSPVLGGGVADFGSVLTIKTDSLTLLDLNNLCTALDTPLKACVSYTISPITINCSSTTQEKIENLVEITQPKPDKSSIFELYQAVLKTFVDQSSGWKKANLFKKQYVFQDFKKNTGMTVDEMLAALNILGDKIEMNLSTQQYIEPLNALAKYYEHQREALKGAEKFSKKQEENLEIIAGWNRDVKALLDALNA